MELEAGRFDLAVFGGMPASTSKLGAAWPRYSPQAIERVGKRLAAGDVVAFGDHEALSALEGWARSYFGVKYALAVASGTAALASSYVALGIGPGDEVLVPSYTFHATATPLLALGAVPVLVDSQPDCTRLDLDDMEARASARTRAVVVSHMFGLPEDMPSVCSLARRLGLPVVEDASQAHGARIGSKLVGTFGAAACFSLGGAKMISGGMGGLLLTDDVEIYERALVYGHSHERSSESLRPSSAYWDDAISGGHSNMRMHVVAADLALDHAETLDERVAVRTAVLTEMSDILADTGLLAAPVTPRDCSRGGWYGYKASYDPDAVDGLPLDDLIAALRAEGMKVARPSTHPLHQLPAFRRSAEGAGAIVTPYPNADRLYERSVALPDKHLHSPAPAVLREYADALAKVRAFVDHYGSRPLQGIAGTLVLTHK